MELYIITIDEVFDFEGFQHKPLVFLTENGARAEFDRLVREARKEYPDFTVDKGKRSVSIYEDQSWSKSHFDVVIDEVDVSGIRPSDPDTEEGAYVVMSSSNNHGDTDVRKIEAARRTLEGAQDLVLELIRKDLEYGGYACTSPHIVLDEEKSSHNGGVLKSTDPNFRTAVVSDGGEFPEREITYEIEQIHPTYL